MNDGTDNSGVVVAIGVILILLLIGGAGICFVVGRQHMALAQADQARLAEAQARIDAEQVRAKAELAVSSATIADDKKTSFGQGDSIRAVVQSILRAQEDAWNRSDIDAFMEHYWKSELLTFSSGGKTTRGWKQTLNRYRERYPTSEKMGQLKFSGLEITPLSESAALVLGQWNLNRESEPLSGNFSLVVRKFEDRWLIIHDHTSRTMD
jgi:beta-aspartyl-peptidase (threonine type)